jgi:hypothetical protein
MSEDPATLDAPLPSDAVPGVQPHDVEANNTELITRRVLLHELLIEEYETHTPFAKDPRPSEDPKPSPEAGHPTRTMPDLLYVRQPALKKSDVDALRPKGESDEKKEALSAGRVKGFFTLLAQAQKKEADEKFQIEDLRKEYRAKIDQAWGKAEEKWTKLHKTSEGFADLEPAAFVDQAIAHEMYGILEDYRERARKGIWSTPGEKLSDAELKQKIEAAALASWINDVHREKSESAAAAAKAAEAAAQTLAPMAVADAKVTETKAHETSATASEASEQTPVPQPTPIVNAQVDETKASDKKDDAATLEDM